MENEIQGYRLSPQQKRVWLSMDDGAAYRAHCALEIDGPLDSPALRRAVEAVAARHEILRTRIERATGIRLPIQVIHSEASVKWIESDGQQEQGLNEEEIREGLRVRLVREAEERHRLEIEISVMSGDRESLRIIGEEVARSYEAEKRGERVEEEVVQYVQFSEWQNEMLEDESAKAGRDFFRERMDSAYSARLLPFETKPSEPERFAPDSYSVMVDAGTTAGIDRLAQELETTPAVLLFALWQILLWRLTGQQDIVAWYTVDGRKYEELRTAPGLYAKSLPINCRFDGFNRFDEAVKQVEQQVREACAYQEYFDDGEWVEKRAYPAFGFEYLESPPVFRAAGATFSLSEPFVCFERFKVKLVIARRGESLRVEFRFEAGRIAKEAGADMAGRFLKLLSSSLEAPRASIAELEIVPEAERRRLVTDLNRTATDYPSDKTIHQLLEEQSVLTPEQTAVVYGEQRLTYRELHERADNLAHRLRAINIGPESLVGICIERSPNMVIGVLGILKAGGAYLPLDPANPKERLAFMLEDARVPVVLASARTLEQFSDLPVKVFTIDAESESIFEQSDRNEPVLASPQNLAYLNYTSGSTGTPKGVMISHSGLVNYLSWCVNRYRVSEGRGCPVHSPLGFDLTVTSLFSPLLVGKSVVLVPEEQGVEGLGFALREANDFSLVKLTPAHLELLNRDVSAKHITGHSNSLIIGGEQLLAESLTLWRKLAPETRLINEYGPTETVVGCCVYEVKPEDPGEGPVPIGRPIANTRLYLLDQALHLAPSGVAGELYIAGAGLARGYLNRPDVTAEKFIPDPFSAEAGARMYRTGDMARYLPNGDMEFLGRSDDQVKIRGYRIEPGEIEAALHNHPAVREAIVVAREDASGNKRLIAYVVSPEDVKTEDLRALLRLRLPDYMIPSDFIIMSELPLTSNGKVDRKALPEPSNERPGLESVYVAPQTPAEEVLSAVWSRVLGVERVGIHDNYFTLGGDSIRSVQLVGLAKEKGLAFTVQQLFQRQTIAELAREVTTINESYIPPITTEPFSLVSAQDREKIPDHVEDAYPLTMLQTGMIYHMQLNPDSPIYHNVSSWHIRVEWDEALFHEAVRQVVAAHPVLRTAFDLTGYSTPLQLVHKKVDVSVPVEDIRHLSLAEQEKALANYFEKVRLQVFDFSRPPLLRYDIHRRTDETIQLTLVECHPIIDGWSTTYTLAEIFTRYFALLDNRPVKQEELSITFRDYVRLEQETVQSQECRQFWAERLAGCAPTKLPRRASNRKKNEERNRVDVLSLPQEVYEGLQRLARAAVVPLKSVLLAAHLKVLSLASGRKEVVTGLSVNGRMEEAGGEQVRGLFLNVVPFRQELKESTWMDLVRETFDHELSILPFRRYPLAAMQQQWGREPIFETLFNYLHFHSVQGVLKSGRLEVLSSKDLSETNYVQMAGFQVDPVSSGLIVRLHADTTVLSDHQIRGLADCYARTLQEMAREPSGYHSDFSPLAILTDWEKIVLKKRTSIEELDATFGF